MFRTLKVLALIATFTFGMQQASALDLGVQVGARMNQSKVDNTTSKDRLGFQGGLLAVVPIVPLIGFRTGALLVQRDAEVEGEALGEAFQVKADRLFADIPLTLQVNAGIAKLYGGANAAIKLASSCKMSTAGMSEDCTLNDEKSVVFQPVVGLDLSILPFISIGAFYEFETEYSKDYKQSAFGVTGSFMF